MPPRVVIIHSTDPVLVLTSEGGAAHVFGPFDSIEAAEAWSAEAPDECFKLALDLVGPDPLDIALSAPESLVDKVMREFH